MLNFRDIEKPSVNHPDIRMLADLLGKIPQLTAADVEQMLPLWNRRVSLQRGRCW